jgi:hypothetical protein
LVRLDEMETGKVHSKLILKVSVVVTALMARHAE